MNKSKLFYIFLAWIIAGTLDISAAIINFKINGGGDPAIIFNYIASSIMGKAADGSTGMLLLGGALHYGVALLCTLIYFLLYHTGWISRRPVIAGLQYGVFVFVIMNMFVVPASKIASEKIGIAQGRIQMGILMLCIGLPIALIADRYFRKSQQGYQSKK